MQIGNALNDAMKLISKIKGTIGEIDGKIKEIDQKLKAAIPVVGEYCAHNYCPPIVPTITPPGVDDFCAHNWCP